MPEIVTLRSDGWVLHGMVHSPENCVGPRIGVVLFHENLNTKFGPHALYRKLACALSRAGFYVLRYDNRGTCDSAGDCELTFANRVADARAALTFFRQHCQLEAVVGWGLCMGAAVAVHVAALVQNSEEKLSGLILCNILAHPQEASLPQFGYAKLDPFALVRDLLFHGGLLRKFWQAPGKLHVYRKNLPRLATNIFRHYRNHEPELDRLRVAIGQVGELLAAYPGPCLLLFGEKDVYRESFLERVNPGDRLGLANKPIPPDWGMVKDGDHTFASAEQTAELIRHTRDWLQTFRKRLSGGATLCGEHNNGISTSPTCD